MVNTEGSSNAPYLIGICDALFKWFGPTCQELYVSKHVTLDSPVGYQKKYESTFHEFKAMHGPPISDAKIKDLKAV